MYKLATYAIMLLASTTFICITFPYVYAAWIALAALGSVFIRDGDEGVASFFGVLYFIAYWVLFLVAISLLAYQDYVFYVSNRLCDISLLPSKLCDQYQPLPAYAFTWSAIFLVLFPMAPISISLTVMSACEGKKPKSIILAFLFFSACSLFSLYSMRNGGHEVDRYKALFVTTRILARDYGALIYIGVVSGVVFWLAGRIKLSG